MVDFEYLNIEFVADVDDFFDASDILDRQVLLRNETLSSGDVLDHRAASHDSSYLSGELTANSDFVGKGLDHRDRILHCLSVVSADEDLSVLLNVDRSSGGAGDLLDDRSSWADDGADLLRVDVDRRNRWGSISNRVSRG